MPFLDKLWEVIKSFFQKITHDCQLYLKIYIQFEKVLRFLRPCHKNLGNHRNYALIFWTRLTKYLSPMLCFCSAPYQGWRWKNSLSKWHQRGALCVFTANDSINRAMNIYGYAQNSWRYHIKLFVLVFSCVHLGRDWWKTSLSTQRDSFLSTHSVKTPMCTFGSSH